MKHTGHKQPAKANDFLVNVARSIGSTLGAVAAKASKPPRAPKKSKKSSKSQAKESKKILTVT